MIWEQPACHSQPKEQSTAFMVLCSNLLDDPACKGEIFGQILIMRVAVVADPRYDRTDARLTMEVTKPRPNTWKPKTDS